MSTLSGDGNDFITELREFFTPIQQWSYNNLVMQLTMTLTKESLGKLVIFNHTTNIFTKVYINAKLFIPLQWKIYSQV